MELQKSDQKVSAERDFISSSNLNITWQEVLTLTNVRSRTPHAFNAEEETDPNQTLSVTVADDLVRQPIIVTSSQEEITRPTTSREVSQQALPARSTLHGKRRRPNTLSI